MSGFFPEDEGGSEFDVVENLAKDAEVKQEVDKPQDKQPTDNNDQVPAKYRGKTVEDIIRMHQEAENLIHRHSEEVGFARRMAEAAAKRLESGNGSPPKREDADQDESVKFFANPKETVNETIAQHPDVVAAREAVRQQQVDRGFNYVKEKLGKDPRTVLQDPDFFPWLQENPFRQQALRHADANNDPNAALEVLTTFEMYKQVKKAQTEQTQKDMTTRQQSDKRAVMVDAGTPGQPDSGTVYRASDLRKLQRTDPARYEKFEDEILKAYSEGRVKFD